MGEGSRWSIGSENSILSIASRGSALSIGSIGSVLSVGSIGSFGSALSIGSFLSLGSALSATSMWSVMSWRARNGVMAGGTSAVSGTKRAADLVLFSRGSPVGPRRAVPTPGRRWGSSVARRASRPSPS